MLLRCVIKDGRYLRVAGGVTLVLALMSAPYLVRIVTRRARLWRFFLDAELTAWARRDSLWDCWSRWSNMRHLLWIENNRQLNIEAVGAEVARNNPKALFAHGVLAHVKTQADIASQKDKQAKAKAASSIPHLKHLVLIGGGHAHAHLLRMNGMQPVAGLRLTLVTRDVLTPYSGMIPGHIAGTYTREECHLDLIQLGEFAKIRVIVDVAVGIDLENRKVMLESGRTPLSYDFLALDVGVSPQVFGQSGYSVEHRSDITTVKPIDRLTYRLARMFDKVANWTRPHTICIVGAGVGGCELSMVVQHRYLSLLKQHNKPAAYLRVVLVGRGERVAPSNSGPVSTELGKILAERGIEVRLEGVEDVKDGKISLGDGSIIECDEVLWNTDGVPHEWLTKCGLTVDEKGFVITDTTLRSVSHPEVFASGDCGTIQGYPRQKSGVFAVFGGLTLWKNINHVVNNEPCEHYTPQSAHLSLINCGDGRAIASRGPLCVPASSWLFELKDWIDRKWMFNYQRDGLPAMDATPIIPGMVASDSAALELLKASTMRCGGCGSKVGSNVLSNALSRLEHRGAEQPALKLSVGEDCAVLEQTPGGVVTVSSVDFFKSGYLQRDLRLLGRIAAQHALSDVWAMGAEPVHALAMVTVPLAMDALMEDDITDILSGATAAFKENGCQLSGGHTTEGELALGFCVEGSAPNFKALWTKGGMKKDHVLVLTKPLGTGVLQAGIMRTRAHGIHIEAMLKVMAESNRTAADTLKKLSLHGGAGVTDVTGFGLLGHLAEMCRESNVRAKVELSKVPLLDGVLEMIQEGIFSTLQPSNARIRHAIDVAKSDATALESPEYAALFDPQTSGGLLISVPADVAASFVKEFPAGRIIGSIQDGAWSNLGGIVVCK